jgi:hypothetical protein
LTAAYGPDKARTRAAVIMLAFAIASVAVAVGSVWVQRSVSGDQTLSGKVLPGFGADMPQVRTITISSKGQTYNLVRRGAAWIMPERGGYRVADAALSEFAKALSDLAYVTQRTSDPSQFAKLGVDDPAQGRDGALVTTRGATGQILTSLHIGQKETALFVRKAGSNDVFEASGTIPDLSLASRWLDLKVLDVTAEKIASVSGQYRGESGFDIVRRPDGGFAPIGGVANVTATTSAIAISKWSPIDVKPASELTRDPVATHVTSLRDGLVISLTAYEDDGRYFVAVSADARAPESNEAATTLNQRSDGWAFEIDATQFADLTFQKAAILSGPIEARE